MNIEKKKEKLERQLLNLVTTEIETDIHIGEFKSILSETVERVRNIINECDKVIELEKKDCISDTLTLDRRNDGNLEGKGYYLLPSYNWYITVDNRNKMVLIRAKKD